MPSTSTMRAEAERPRAADRLLLGTARRSWRGLAVILLAQVGGALTTLLVPYVLADTVDAVLNQQTPASALARLAGVLAADLTLGVLAVVSGTYVVAGATAWLRRRLLGHVLALGIAGRRRHASGDLTTRLINDVEQTSSAAPAIIEAVVAMGLAAGGAVALWLIDVRLVVAFCAGLPLAWLAVRVLVTDLSDLFLRYSRVLGQIAARLSDALGGVRTIRASGTLDRECSRVLAPLPELSQAGYAMWLAERRLASQLGIITPLIHIAVLAVAGFGVSAGRISSGQFVAVGFYVGIALGVLNAADGLLTLAQARAGAWRVVEVLRDEPYPRGTSGLPPGPGALTLRDVTVRGTDDQVILDRLDLCVPPGVAVALIGASGAGKSTLAMVAGGLVVPDSGEVQLDGVPLMAIGPERLRRAVAYAFERPCLLGRTIAEAIGYARPEAPRRDIEHAAVIAHAEEFVRRLPQGYDTAVAQAPMSGGEAQRLSLARAVVGDARLVILDDATSSLDTVTEAQVSAAVTRRLAGRTRLVVTHRATTAARADLVAWLDAGRIRALAPHSRLWADPDYRAVFGHDEATDVAPASRPALRVVPTLGEAR